MHHALLTQWKQRDTFTLTLYEGKIWVKHLLWHFICISNYLNLGFNLLLMFLNKQRHNFAKNKPVNIFLFYFFSEISFSSWPREPSVKNVSPRNSRADVRQHKTNLSVPRRVHFTTSKCNIFFDRITCTLSLVHVYGCLMVINVHAGRQSAKRHGH